MNRRDKQILKESIKQGDIPSLLTYLKMREKESLEKLILSANNTKTFQAQTLAFREIISLYNN